MSFTQTNRPTDWLKGEQETPTDYSRSVVTIKSGQTLLSGTVLAKLTSGGKYVEFDPGASVGAGSDTAVAILLLDTDASAGDVEATVIARNALISAAGLGWLDTDTSGNKAAAIVSLALKGIIVRENA